MTIKRPTNTDTVPAMLTPNEYVVPADVVEFYGPEAFMAVQDFAERKMYKDGGIVRENPRQGIFGDQSLVSLPKESHVNPDPSTTPVPLMANGGLVDYDQLRQQYQNQITGYRPPPILDARLVPGGETDFSGDGDGENDGDPDDDDDGIPDTVDPTPKGGDPDGDQRNPLKRKFGFGGHSAGNSQTGVGIDVHSDMSGPGSGSFGISLNDLGVPDLDVPGLSTDEDINVANLMGVPLAIAGVPNPMGIGLAVTSLGYDLGLLGVTTTNDFDHAMAAPAVGSELFHMITNVPTFQSDLASYQTQQDVDAISSDTTSSGVDPSVGKSGPTASSGVGSVGVGGTAANDAGSLSDHSNDPDIDVSGHGAVGSSGTGTTDSTGIDAVGGQQGNAVGAGPGGGGDGGDKIICGELHRQGYIPTKIYRADLLYHSYYATPEATWAYHAWAGPYVRLMKKSRLATLLVLPFGRTWAYQMAYELGYYHKKPLFGSVLTGTITRIHWLVGKMFGPQRIKGVA